jgi:hypothetical protein
MCWAEDQQRLQHLDGSVTQCLGPVFADLDPQRQALHLELFLRVQRQAGVDRIFAYIHSAPKELLQVFARHADLLDVIP